MVEDLGVGSGFPEGSDMSSLNLNFQSAATYMLIAEAFSRILVRAPALRIWRISQPFAWEELK